MIISMIKKVLRLLACLPDLAKIIPGIDSKNLTFSDRLIIYLSHGMIALMFLLMWLVLVFR